VVKNQTMHAVAIKPWLSDVKLSLADDSNR